MCYFSTIRRLERPNKNYMCSFEIKFHLGALQHEWLDAIDDGRLVGIDLNNDLVGLERLG